MPSYTPERARVVAQLASLSFSHPDDPRIPELRAEVITLKLIAAIEKNFTAEAPLNPEQQSRIVKAIYGNLGRG